MKKTALILTSVIGLSAWAQTPPAAPAPPATPVSPAPPANPVTPVPPVSPTAPTTPTTPVQPVEPATPVSPNPPLSPSPAGPGSGGVSSPTATPFQGFLSNQFNFTNRPAVAQGTNAAGDFTSQFPTGQNASLGNVESALVNLQANIEQALPALNSLMAAANNRQVGLAQGAAPLQRPNAIPGQNPRLAPTGVMTPGTTGTTRFATDAETARLLAVLDYNLRQTLPILQVLNGRAMDAGNRPGAAPQPSFSSRFAPLTNAPARLPAR